MRARSIILLTTVLLMAGAPAHATSVACTDTGGVERLTSEGFSASFEAPAVTAPELAATYAETGPLVTPHRTVSFPFVVDATPRSQVEIAAAITWETPSDYDLYLIDESDGSVLARSDEALGDGQDPTSEAFVGGALHCQRVRLIMRNWAGIPLQQIDLEVTVTPAGGTLSCEAADPAPGCEGKAEGEAPELVADDSTRLWLAGDPGQASMVNDYQETLTQEQWPFSATLSTERPTGGVSNQHTRALVGFRDQPRNPLFAHFEIELDAPLEISGSPSVLLWVQTPAGGPPTRLFADLWTDDFLLASAEMEGGDLVGARDPIPVILNFDEVDATAFTSLIVKIGMEPVATSDGAVGTPEDAHLTLWYGSAQFQSRLTL
jgi:hypothetical protein